MTVGELLKTMSAKELGMWRGLYLLEDKERMHKDLKDRAESALRRG